MAILVLNGPNLNLLGTREPEVYGTASLQDVIGDMRTAADRAGIELRDTQSNQEGELIDALHDARTWASGVIFNPGAYGHTSIALRDAVASIEIPVIEVHLSNVHAREDFRHTSLLTAVCWGVVAGFGPAGYLAALDLLVQRQ